MDAKQQAECFTEPVALNVVMQVWPGRVIDEVGHMGYAPTASMIQLTFDSADPNFDANLGEHLSRTLLTSCTIACVGTVQAMAQQ